MFLANDYLPRVPRQSHLSAGDEGDNDVELGLWTGVVAFILQLRNLAMLPVTDLNGVPYFQNDVSRIAQHVGEGEGRKDE